MFVVGKIIFKFYLWSTNIFYQTILREWHCVSMILYFDDIFVGKIRFMFEHGMDKITYYIRIFYSKADSVIGLLI
jgi:hypothetical protein